MAKMATRSVRGLVALVFVAACTFVGPNFSMLGGSVQRPLTTSRTTTHALATPVSGSGAMDTIFYKIATVNRRLTDRAWLGAPTDQELADYDQKMTADIKMLEDLIQEASMEVETTTQVQWLENALETVGQLKERLSRHRDAEAAAKMPRSAVAGDFGSWFRLVL